jgi:hypothetical protein
MGKHVHLKVVVGRHDDYADLDLELPTLVDLLSSVVKNSHKANSKNSIS